MSLLPAVIGAPMPDAYIDALGVGDLSSAAPDAQLVQSELVTGLPATIALDGARSLVLAVPLGVASVVLGADPLAVVVDSSAASPFSPGPQTRRELDAAWPRLTLLDGGQIADTAAVVLGVPLRLGHGGAAAVEVVIDRLLLTAGTLRSPGRFGSLIALRWRDLLSATGTGPPPTIGDPALSVLAGAAR